MPDPTVSRRRLLVALSAIGLVVLGAELAARLVVDEEFVSERLAGRLGAGPARVSLDDVSFSLLARRIEASGIAIGRADVGTVYAERVVASGLPLLALLTGEATPEVGRLEVSRPFVFLHPAPVPEGGASGRAEVDARPADGAAYRAGGVGEAAEPALRIGELRIDAGTLLAWRPGAASGPGRVLVRDFAVEGRQIALGRDGRPTGPQDGLSWRTGAFTRVRADGLTRVAWDSMRASVRDSTFRIFGGRYEPTVPDTTFFRQLDDREDRIRVSSPRISARGFDFSLRPEGGFVARTIVLDSTDVDVFSNRRVPDTDATASRPWMPHTLVGSFDGRLRVDTVELTGRVAYGELPVREVVEPGRFVFEDFAGRITGISNQPEAPPMAVEATMDVFGAPSTIRLEIPLDVDRMLMRMDGRVGALDLRRLNTLTVPLQGVEIQDGRLAGIRFDITVDGPTAGGTVWVAYRDLDVQIVDSGTGDGGLFDDIKSFVANTFVLRGDNMPGDGDGEEAVPGTVEY
ncbi:MAG TPA: hypothetical protein ENO23_07650, partial [Alphaproteobacteria bacterium]|nr:hypothetical protein [Alphaproteobacteria bacterium]